MKIRYTRAMLNAALDGELDNVEYVKDKRFGDVFLCALLNSQPMGFYAPAQLVRDAREHEVEVRPVDVNYSSWDNMLEPSLDKTCWAVRLGVYKAKFRITGGTSLAATLTSLRRPLMLLALKLQSLLMS